MNGQGIPVRKGGEDVNGDIGLIGTAVGEMSVNAPDLADWAQESWFVAGIDDPEPSTTEL